MCAERRKVLELLAQGKITADEAEKLLNKLDSLSGSQAEPESTTSESKATETKPLRFLRVEVEKPGSTENVNVRIPLSFLRASAGRPGKALGQRHRYWKSFTLARPGVGKGPTAARRSRR